MIGNYIAIDYPYSGRLHYRISKIHLSNHTKNVGYILDYIQLGGDVPPFGADDNAEYNSIWLSKTFLEMVKAQGNHVVIPFDGSPEKLHSFLTEDEFLLDTIF